MAVVRKLIQRDFELSHWHRFCDGMIEHFDKMAIYVMPHDTWVPVKKVVVEKWRRTEMRPGYVGQHSNCIRWLALRNGSVITDSVSADFAIDGDEEFIMWLCLRYL